jgi:hypothetical protein
MHTHVYEDCHRHAHIHADPNSDRYADTDEHIYTHADHHLDPDPHAHAIPVSDTNGHTNSHLDAHVHGNTDSAHPFARPAGRLDENRARNWWLLRLHVNSARHASALLEQRPGFGRSLCA